MGHIWTMLTVAFYVDTRSASQDMVWENLTASKLRSQVNDFMNLGKFDHDRSLFSSKPGIMANKGNHPQMAQQFRLVRYYNLPR